MTPTDIRDDYSSRRMLVQLPAHERHRVLGHVILILTANPAASFRAIDRSSPSANPALEFDPYLVWRVVAHYAG